MPTYFFHTDNGTRVEDAVGVELPNQARAHRDAIRLTGAMLKDEPGLLFGDREFRMEVADENGTTLFTILVQAAAGVMPANT